MLLKKRKLLKPLYSNGFSATPSPVGVPEFQSFRIGWSSGLDITKGVGETMRLQLMCCALSNLSSSQFTEGQNKNNKGNKLKVTRK